MATATTRAPDGAPLARARTSADALPLALGLGAAALAVVLAVAAAGAGSTAFPVHPVGLGALLAAGLALLLPAREPERAGLVTAAAAGLLLYGLLGAAAAAAAAGAAAAAAAPALAALWGAAWLPPLVATSAAALAALPRAASSRTNHRVGAGLVVVVLVAGVVTTAATAVLQRPVEPFAGVPPAAPDAWTVTGRGLLDTSALVLAASLLAAPALLALAGVRRRGAERARAVLLALGASTPVLVVVVCVLLAVARDPGGVDPSVGSTGFLVVMAAGTWAGCAGVRAATGSRPGAALLAARCAAGAVVVLAVLAAGVVLAALLDGAPLLLVVGAVALLAAGGLEGWRRASGWAAALLEESVPAPAEPPAALPPPPPPPPVAAPVAAPVVAPPAPRGWDELTPREREVLAVLASGASNAGIAAELGISPRTVEAHLRSVFTRLCLDPADGANRRVVAAGLWLAHGGSRDDGRRAAAGKG